MSAQRSQTDIEFLLASVQRLAEEQGAFVPSSCDAILSKIALNAKDAFQLAESAPPGDADAMELYRLAEDYLPKTVESYFAFPVGMRDVPNHRDGDTPETELLEQLNVILSRIDELARNLSSNTLSQQAANGRFLKDRLNG